MALNDVHQYLGYAAFLVSLIVTGWSIVAARTQSPSALRGLAGSLAGLLDLQVLLGLSMWLGIFGMRIVPQTLHLITALLAAIVAHLGARQLRTAEGMRTARWYQLGVFVLLLVTIGIASM
mgnify:CR=1 FL=1